MSTPSRPFAALGCDLDGWEQLNRSMIDDLIGAGFLSDHRWRQAFTNVPRHRFVPRFVRPGGLVDCADPDTFEQWRKLVYTDTTLIVQTTPAPHYDTELSTSSSTLPSLMARMLELLEVDDETTVLEIGTATGYNTAVLCQALGDDRITTIELHPELASLAQRRLSALGMAPTTIIGDGAVGYAPNASYDRILATCAANRIPTEWVAQLGMAGCIVTDLRAEVSTNLAVLRKIAPDRVEGPLLDFPGHFMWLRPDPHSPLLHPDRSDIAIHRDDENNRISITSHDPHLLRESGLRVALGALEPTLRVPLSLTGEIEHNGEDDYFLYSDDGSWSDAVPVSGGRFTVTQGGPRRVWDSVERAITRWDDMGRPARGRYGLTVTTDGEHCYWVDDPSHPLYPDETPT